MQVFIAPLSQNEVIWERISPKLTGNTNGVLRRLGVGAGLEKAHRRQPFPMAGLLLFQKDDDDTQSSHLGCDTDHRGRAVSGRAYALDRAGRQGNATRV